MNDVAYARAEDGTHVAYRVLPGDGGGGLDHAIVMVSGGLFPIEVFEDDPGCRRLLEGLRGLGPVVVFDRRGVGLSDPIVDWTRHLLDQWAEDMAAVVAASGVTAPTIFSWDGYGIATRFAACNPDRVGLLVIYQPAFPVKDEEVDDFVATRIAMMRSNIAGAEEDFLERIAPSRAGDAQFREWYARAGRVGASPATASRIWETLFTMRAADLMLETVASPTLVLARRNTFWAWPDAGRVTAAQISNAKLVELDGADHFPFLGDVDAIVAEVADFVVGERRLPPPQRLLAAVMFTDLVGSTEHAATVGDAHWKAVLDRHDAVSRAAIGSSGGTVVKNTGDGVLALLPSTGSAVRAAERIRHALAAENLAVRIGIHVGDVDRRGDDVSGLGVVVAARTMAIAGTGEIVVTASVVAAMAGQATMFESLGPHTLKGVPGVWELSRVTVAPPG